MAEKICEHRYRCSENEPPPKRRRTDRTSSPFTDNEEENLYAAALRLPSPQRAVDKFGSCMEEQVNSGLQTVLPNLPQYAPTQATACTHPANAETITEGVNLEDDIWCFGMLQHIRLEKMKGWNTSETRLRISAAIFENNDDLVVQSTDTPLSGIVECRLSKILRALRDDNRVRIQYDIILPQKPLPGPKQRKFLLGAECTFATLTATIYGHMSVSELVGNYLLQCEEYLQLPTHCNFDVPYRNPQSLCGADEFAPTTFQIRAVSSTSHIQELKQAKDPSDSLESTRIHAEVAPPPALKTALFSHQKQALSFMLNREKGWDLAPGGEDIWEEVRGDAGETPIYYNTITKEISLCAPCPFRGGILADAMGLGKSLSIIALVAASLGDVMPPIPVTGQTLLVVPLSLLQTWNEQLSIHVYSGSLTWFVYHGAGKNADEQTLKSHDIIITTYDVVVSRWRRLDLGPQPLFSITWNRIILDEAHEIRESKTSRAKAVFQLRATCRWVVSGTPIQNRLNDLASLLNFLRILPSFNLNQLNSLLESIDATPELRKRLMSICLRRPKSALALPSRKTQIRIVEFNERERNHYREANKAIYSGLTSSGASEIRQHANLLTKINSLRQICNLGLLYEVPFHQAPCAGSGEIFQGMRDQGLPAEMLLDEDSDCAICQENVSLRYTGIEDGDEIRSFPGYLTTCGCIICNRCSIQFDRLRPLPCCEHLHPCGIIELTDSNFQLQPQLEVPADCLPAKMRMLQEDILATSEIDKCVVFSLWTSTLDAVQIALRAVEIPFVRVDGSMSPKRREETIVEFKKPESGIRAILFSLHCGANGLNLTAANHVFLMEPQWNPMLEDQALDRVYRIGQHKEVTTIRYVVKNTLEENIRNLQDRKRNLAKKMLEMSRIRSSWIQEIHTLLGANEG